MLKYNYAYDENRNIINIADVPQEGHLERVFFCIGCGNQMVAAIGPKRRYFKHKSKADETNWCNESYLHKLAKIVIKQKFDDFSNPFNIQVKGGYVCNKNQQCKWHNEHFCENTDIQSPIDLHEHYNLCEEEKRIKGYIADLLLTNTDSSKNYAPILIEIKYKHKCTEEKFNSNLKIIEVCIDSEKDIDWLKENTWKDSEKKGNYESELPQIKFNFNRKKEEREFCDSQPDGSISYNFTARYKNRFVYYPNRTYYITERICFELDKAYSNNSIVELNYPKHTDTLEIAHFLKRVMNIELKSCSICSHFVKDKQYCSFKSKNETSVLSQIYKAIEINDDSIALECSNFQLKCLNSLYKHLPEEQRLKDDQVEIIKRI